MTVTNWLWFVAVGVVPNVLALALLVVGLRAATVERLTRLQKRAIACVIALGLGSAVAVALGATKAFLAMHGDAVDVSQKARLLADGIAEAMNGIALAMLASPLPIAAIIVIVVRAKRLARLPPPSPP